MSARFNILTLNVRGLCLPHKQDLVLRELSRLNYDFFFLQETHVSCAEQARKIQRKWNENIYWSFGTKRSAGVAILCSPNFSGSISRFVHDTEGRIISALALIDSTSTS